MSIVEMHIARTPLASTNDFTFHPASNWQLTSDDPIASGLREFDETLPSP
jgi:hypothetical protein